MENSIKFLDLFNSERVAIFLHENPDSDCVCSAFALKEILKKSKVDIYGQIFKNRFTWIQGIDSVKDNVDKSVKYDHCIFLDSPTMRRVYKWQDALEITKNSKTWILDHHANTKNEFKEITNPFVFLVETDFSSTCEIIWKILVKAASSNDVPKAVKEQITLPRRLMKLLLSGIYWETRQLLTSNANTFRHIGEMMRTNPKISFQDIEKESAKMMLRFERFWAHSLLNNSVILRPSNIMVVEVIWKEFISFFYWFNGENGKALYRKEKLYTYLMDKSLNIRLDEGGGSVKSAIVIYPSKIKPETEYMMMYESLTSRSDKQHEKLLSFGFKCAKSDKKRYNLFEVKDKEMAKKLIKEIQLLDNE